ncbi:MAG: hypothetical protein CMO81_00090 [Waddliaceae bacterium]|nr:hypothetical protein [Waddliaceae bacterium]|tara:strand:+ start:94 stop:591 length:498 start_codon:yes stop_codon:yes gene_type:complete
MKQVLIFLLIGNMLFADEWIDSVANRVDEDAVNWANNLLNSQLRNKSPCGNCISPSSYEGESNKTLILMSFSIPEDIWLSLSLEAEKKGASFVIKGLPENSFSELAYRIAEMKKRGLNTPIRLDPNLFDEYAVSLVPTFILDGRKISGTISLDYAEEKLREGKSV